MKEPHRNPSLRYTLPLMICSMVGLIIASFVPGFAANEHTEKHNVATSGERYDAIQKFKSAVLNTNGTLDAVHTPGGVIVVVTAGNAESVPAIQAAAKEYLAGARKRVDKGSDGCAKISQGVVSGKVREDMSPTGSGVVFLIASQDESLANVIQLSDCCQWCGPCGPHSTAGCCSRC